MKIELIDIAELKPLEKNVRKHNLKQIDELIRSLNQFGQTRAIIVDEDNNILIGNGLYMAMKERGDTKAECSRIAGLTKTQKKKLVITDNKVFSLGIDDYSVITEFINEITLEGDFDIAGFDDDVIRQMTKELHEVNHDIMNYGKVEENTVKPQIEPARDNKPEENAYSYAQPDTAENNYSEERYTAPAETKAEIRNDKTIICPCCGELIHLD